MRPTRTLLSSLVLAPLAGAVAAQCPVETFEASAPKSSDQFGDALSVWGDTLVVGKPRFVPGGLDGDAAHVFERTQAGWVESQILSSPDAVQGEWFGDAVALVGDTILVGDPGWNSQRGKAYLYERNAGVWSNTGSLLAGGGGIGELFGATTAISDDGQWAAVTALNKGNGHVYVYENNAGTWTQKHAFTTNTSSSPIGFGVSLDFEGEWLAVGDWHSNVNGLESGSVYLYREQGGSWTLQQRIEPGDGAADDNFGIDVSLEGDRLLVGACGDDNDSGSAYLYELVGGSWIQVDKIFSEQRAPFELFAISVHLEGGRALLGETGPPFTSGRAALFDLAGSNLNLAETIEPQGASSDAFFGVTVEIEDGELFVGADNDIVGGSFTHGAVRTYATQGMAMLASADALSVTSGGQVNYRLVTCPPEPGDTFLMLGSLSGTTPGYPVSSLVLPLVVDPYTFFTLPTCRAWARSWRGARARRASCFRPTRPPAWWASRSTTRRP